MRQMLLTTVIVVPLGCGVALAQQAQEPAEEGAEAEVQVLEPESVATPDVEAAAEGAEEAGEAVGEAVEETGEAVDEAVEGTGEALEGAAEEAEGEVLEVEPVEEGETVAAEGAADEVVVREQAQNELRLDWITDGTLLSPEGERIGGIEDVILDGETGQLSAVIVGVGGFLGIGEKKIAVAWDQLQINYDANEVSADLTREEAEAAPEYVFRAQEAPPLPEPAPGVGVDTGLGVGTTPPPAAD